MLKKNTCLCILSYDSAITARIPSKYGPLAAQSLEDPDPYSLPTRAIKAVINFSDKIHNTPAPSITLGLLVFVQLNSLPDTQFAEEAIRTRKARSLSNQEVYDLVLTSCVHNPMTNQQWQVFLNKKLINKSFNIKEK
ncbi:hypothetical protein ALC53_06234 [Atta colombica]|uniref:Uncharacterized protein n=1 Tax=Atta colombica TaxID=520822 RepID=A0A151I3I1_9HYME|nr:hypothetical protein ALC53_06234 [Atta colombica]